MTKQLKKRPPRKSHRTRFDDPMAKKVRSKSRIATSTRPARDEWGQTAKKKPWKPSKIEKKGRRRFKPIYLMPFFRK